ncbi:MAG: bifunctional glutamate N-acetyltransferase/amino-acid acetyltransferase ArgJ [Chloroflexi bacterium]|nr:bifunctional glutamate N-acetyltransferase/amino-acid acetyltransferase ArgJ [Chloroflexota bacterium]
MVAEPREIRDGTVTTPRGFLAGATYAGLKTYGVDKLDLGILFSERPATAAGVFSTNHIVSPSVTLSKRHIASGYARAIVANSGCANCCVGPQGLKDAQEVVAIASRKLGVAAEEILVCSTGLIGVELPMALLRQAIPKVQLSADGGHALARAIMTTDSRPKEAGVSFTIDGVEASIGGIAKGAGMIHPNMATMLCFMTTDLAVEPGFLQRALREAADASFNMVSVDGDSSTNDSLLLLANGTAGNKEVREGTPQGDAFRQALEAVCVTLAQAIAYEGEGATKGLEVVVEGARTLEDARCIARSVASSSLVKTALHGNDPNWGRIMMALGKTKAYVEEGKVALYINDVCILEEGRPIPFLRDAVVKIMSETRVSFRIQLNLGDSSARAWGCDLSEEYVTFNSAYTT